MRLFPARRKGRPGRGRPGPKPAFRMGRLLPWILCCLACLIVAACDGGKADGPGDAGKIAPSDLFSQRAPRRPGMPAIPGKERRILVVGDSLSISLGEQLERVLSGTPGIEFTRDGLRSTGLTRPELLDWPARLRELASRLAPDVVVVMLGANDTMPVSGPDGGRIYFDNPAWSGAYAAKARELVAICREANPEAVVYWVGIPAMGEPSLATGSRQVNAALSAMCGDTPGCRFIDTQAAFSDPEGKFSRHGRDAATGDTVVLRTADGVHLTDGGARLLAGVVLAALADRENLPQSAGQDELRLYARDVRPVADEAHPAGRDVQVGPSPAKAGGPVYTVKKGDTVLSIAKRLGMDPEELMAANPGLDSRRLSLGQPIRLPAKREPRSGGS